MSSETLISTNVVGFSKMEIAGGRRRSNTRNVHFQFAEDEGDEEEVEIFRSDREETS